VTPVPCVASVDFRRFARGKNGARAKKRKEGEGKDPQPLVRFMALVGKTPKLLPNPTETLAMQAMTPEVYYGSLAKTYKFPPHGTKTYPLMKYLAMDIEGSKAKKKLATLNLKGNRVGKKTTLRIWWISFAIEKQEETGV